MKTIIMILLIYFLLSSCSKRYYLTPKKSATIKQLQLWEPEI